jgi:hypothetical protein
MKSFAASAAIVMLIVLPETAVAQTGTAPYCLQSQAGARCVFGTMGECESARGSTGDTAAGQCITRTDAQGTTGLGDRPAAKSGTRMAPPPSAGPEGEVPSR